MGRPRKSISELQTASITFTVTEARKAQIMHDAAAARMSVSAYLAQVIFAPGARANPGASHDVEHLFVRLRCASALEELSRKTVELCSPEQCFDFGITLMSLERALMPEEPFVASMGDWDDDEEWA